MAQPRAHSGRVHHAHCVGRSPAWICLQKSHGPHVQAPRRRFTHRDVCLQATSTGSTALGVLSMNPSQASSRETLTRQQRNMVLAEPIARLSLERRVIFKDDPAISERLDVQYLALSAIDFVMERSAIESGAAPEAIVEHVAGEVARVNPTLTDEQGRKVGQVVLDHLSNARESHKAFRVEYFDADRGGFAYQDFRLLALSTADDGSPRFKLARGAQTLTLAMLDVAPEFAQEAEAIMIRKAVERGRVQDARTLANRSRMRSIHYRQFIEDRLFQVRRAADRVTWSEEVVPELDRAREHLTERRKHEATIIDSICEHIANAKGDTRNHLVELKNTIDDCHQRHGGAVPARHECIGGIPSVAGGRIPSASPAGRSRPRGAYSASPPRSTDEHSCRNERRDRDGVRRSRATTDVRSGLAVLKRHTTSVPPRSCWRGGCARSRGDRAGSAGVRSRGHS